MQYTALAMNVSTAFVRSWQYNGGQGVVGKDRGNYTQIKPSEREYNVSETFQAAALS